MTRTAKTLALTSSLLMAGCVGTLIEEGPEARRDAGVFIFLDAGTSDADVGPPRPDTGPPPPGVDAGPPPPGVDAGPPPVDAGVDSGPPPGPCDGVSCGANSSCQPATGACRCDVGFIDDGGGCVAPPAGDPAIRTESEVCDAWAAGRVENASPAWTAGSGGCDPGSMSSAAIDDTLRRVNVYRWLAGLPPVSHNASAHDQLMECAYMMDRNNALSHSPPTGWTCYTSGGASAAGRSNIALGYTTPGSAIDGYMRDRNTMSLGHRRWILGARLGSVEIGFAGRGQCLGVFGGGGSTSREWTAYPNQGFAPAYTAMGTWSFHVNSISLPSSATVTVTRASDGANLAVDSYFISGGGGPPATLAWIPSGWSAAAGETYRVTIGGTGGGDVTYEVTIAGC